MSLSKLFQHPPKHTFPPWDSRPKRPDNIALGAALHVIQIDGLHDDDCNNSPMCHVPSDEAWQNNKCRVGVVFYCGIPCKLTMIVVDRVGVGCNLPAPTCYRTYTREINLQPGLNFLLWCKELGIRVSTQDYLSLPRGLKASNMGPTLYFMKIAGETMDRYDIHRGNYVNKHSSTIKYHMPNWTMQPRIIPFNQGEELKMDSVMLYHPGSAPPIRMLAQLEAGEDALLIPQPGFPPMERHFNQILHFCRDKHYWPGECLCGARLPTGQVLPNGMYKPNRYLRLCTAAEPWIVQDDEQQNIFIPQAPQHARNEDEGELTIRVSSVVSLAESASSRERRANKRTADQMSSSGEDGDEWNNSQQGSTASEEGHRMREDTPAPDNEGDQHAIYEEDNEEAEEEENNNSIGRGAEDDISIDEEANVPSDPEDSEASSTEDGPTSEATTQQRKDN